MGRKKREPFLRVHRGADGTTYTTQVRVRGHKATQTFDSRDAALRWHADKTAEFRRLHERGHALRSDVSQLTIADLITDYLKDPETKAQKSFDDTEARLAWWVNQHGGVNLLDFGLLQIRAAREDLPKRRSASTANRYMGCMRSCWHWAMGAGYVPEDRPWPRRTMLPEPRGRQRYLTTAELAHLLETAKSDPLIAEGIVVALTTGLRESEMLRLDWDDIDFAAKKLTVHESKTGEPRKVHLPAPAIAALKRLRQLMVGPTFVFPTPTGKARIDIYAFARRWRVVRAAAGLQNFRWHDLRHSTASFLASKGASLPAIGSVLGHKSAMTTARYAHLVQGEPLKQHEVFEEILK